MGENNIWLTAKELAGVANLPESPAKIKAIAQKQYWEKKKEKGTFVYNLLKLPKEIIDEILFARAGLQFAEGCNSHNTQTWFLSKELVGVGGLTQHFTSINAHARVNNWIKRKARRGNKTFMQEFHVSSFPEAMQIDLGFIPKNSDFSINEEGKWFTAKELAGKAGLPSSTANLTRMATKKQWKRRVALAGIGRKPFEYHIDSLPEEVKESILSEQK